MVVSYRYPYLEVELTVRGYRSVVWGYIDTGFDGYVAIPRSLQARIGAPDYVVRWELADTSGAEAGEYLGTIRLVGEGGEMPARVTVLGDEFLIGRAIVDRFRVTFEHGRMVTVER